MRIAGLYEYPIKGCGGVSQKIMSVNRYGPAFDRKFMIINAKTRTMVTQRTHPQLALVETEIRNGSILIKAPGTGSLELELARPLGDQREVSIHDQPACIGFLYGVNADDFFSRYLGGEFELIRYATKKPRVRNSSVAPNYRVDSFADAHPLLILSRGAISRLMVHSSLALQEKNFRPNILVEDCSPHAEDEKLTLANSRVRMRWVKLCGRCSVPDVDPQTGKRYDKHPVTNALRATRPLDGDGVPVFGSNYMVEVGGILSIGEKLTVL